MKYFLALGLCIVIIQQSVAPPVTKEENVVDEGDHPRADVNQLEYRRYLSQVVDYLEKDEGFRAKLENASSEAIRTGEIAYELEFVDHQVRSKLDELKRQELKRLRDLYKEEMELENNKHRSKREIHHLDHENPHTFEIDDLKKLITKTTKDLDEIDRKRKEEFKEYEMQKKYDQEQKKKEMDEEHRKKYEEELHQMEEKHKKHAPLHHPGSEQQLKEVWEKEDHMEKEKFDPKTFFFMHDIDGNGFWDPDEVKALFRRELDKLYEAGHPEDDIRERAEEMERMREEVYSEADKNKDGLINYLEFLEQTDRTEFKKDHGWKTLDEQELYSLQEYDEFVKRKNQEKYQEMLTRGIVPPHPDLNGHPQQYPPQYGHVPPQGMPNPQVPYHGQPMQPPQYQQHPPQYQGQVPPHQAQGQVPQYQQVPPQYQGQVPPQGYVPQQAVPQQQYQGQPPQQQYQGQPPQQQYQGQPPQQQQYQGQVPQQGQIPQQPQQGQIPQQPQQGQIPQQPQQGQIPQQPQQGQIPQQPQPGQIPQQQQVPVPVNQQPQGQQVQQNPLPVQATGNAPVPNSIPEAIKV